MTAAHDDAVEALLDRAFGLDRRERTAYSIRTDATPDPRLSFGALADGVLVGSAQCWPVELARDTGGVARMTMIGPIAVDPAMQRAGLGRRLTAAVLRAAQSCGADDALMLIGNPEYYGRFFGFDASRTRLWRLPGPVERHRLLARGRGIPDAAGIVRAASNDIR